MTIISYIDNSPSVKNLFDELIGLITNSQVEICVKNNESLPKVYYIGVGKSGSKSLMFGIEDTVAHWHRELYFEKIYNTDILSKYHICLYDLVLYIGKKYDFKPLIIESYREPIIRYISMVMQDVNMKRKEVENYSGFIRHLSPDLIKRRINPYSLKWKDYFNIDLITEFDRNKNYYYQELENVKLLFLKLEDSKNWDRIIGRSGYRFKNIKINDSTKRPFAVLYQEVLENYKLSEIELDEIYDNKIMKAFYSEEEINTFKNKWKK